MAKNMFNYQRVQHTNPNAVKFLPNMHFFESGTVEFLKESDKLDQSPIAKLFDIEGIDIVMIGFNFISVTRIKLQNGKYY